LGNPLNRIRLNDDRRHLALGEVPPDVAVEWPLSSSRSSIFDLRCSVFHR
jgi:hypothetical protein